MGKCRRFQVSGRVQGVFFRISTQRYASQLGLTGWVRNRADGSVELVACGASDALDKLEQWLWRGPDRANVSKVHVTPVEFQVLDGFDIR